MALTQHIELARNGDHDAFAVLAKGAYDRLYAVAQRVLRDSDLAKDAVQEALIRAWRDLPALRDPDNFDAWLYRLTVNACKDLLRRRRRRPIEVAVTDLSPPNGDDGFQQLSDREELERAFAELPVEHRAVLVLVHYVGLSPAEVADTLGIPVGTVYSRLHYGTQRARSALTRETVPVGQIRSLR